MAKINHITIKDVTRYLETIAYLPELPTATEDSADLVSVNNTLYVKQVTDGVYSYGTIQAGDGPSGDGVTVIEINLGLQSYTETDGTDGWELNLTEEEQDLLENGAYLKIKWIDEPTDSWEGTTWLYPSSWIVLFGTVLIGRGHLVFDPFIYLYWNNMLIRCSEGYLKEMHSTMTKIDSNNNTFTLTKEQYFFYLDQPHIYIDDTVFVKTLTDYNGFYWLSLYDADANEWYHYKPVDYNDETKELIYQLDEEDHSSPYCDGDTGGSSVVVNSSDAATGTLTKLTVDGVTYGVPVVEIEDLTSL